VVLRVSESDCLTWCNSPFIGLAADGLDAEGDGGNCSFLALTAGILDTGDGRDCSFVVLAVDGLGAEGGGQDCAFVAGVLDAEGDGGNCSFVVLAVGCTEEYEGD
jgi:hypothetical protein